MDKHLLIIDLISKAWTDTKGICPEFQNSPCFSVFLDAALRLRTEELYQSRLHGQGHIERVMLLGAVLAWRMGLSPEELNELLFCCAYHDIGRTHDHREDEHGENSSRIIVRKALFGYYPEISEARYSIILASIAAHSVSSRNQAEFAVRWSVSETQKADFCKLASLLKDSDGLDRVRLKDLDPERLRNPEAKELILFAKELFDAYKLEEANRFSQSFKTL